MSVTISSLVWLGFTYTIIIPICTFAILNYWKHRRETLIHLRRPKFVTVSNSIALFFIGIICPFYNIYLDINKRRRDLFISILYTIGLLIPLILNFTRGWYAYYDFKYNNALKHRVWMDAITENEENNWYITHRQSWGSSNFIFKIICVYIILFLIIEIIASQIFGILIGELITILCLVLTLIPLTFLYTHVKAPNSLYLRQELMIIIIVSWIYIISEILIDIIFHNDHAVNTIFYGTYRSSLILSLSILISTLYILHINKKLSKKTKNNIIH